MLIKNVLSHPDDLHDGRTIDAYATADITPEELALEHYQRRLRDGLLVVAEDEQEPLKVAEVVAAIDAASAEERETVKAQFREAEEASPRPRQGVLDATKPSDKETS